MDKNKVGQFKKAKHFYKWFLQIFGYAAVVNPFSLTCHVLPDCYPPSTELKSHEEAHFRQIKNDGVIKFCLKYLWYLIIYGYKNSPYEKEARTAAGKEVLRKYT